MARVQTGAKGRSPLPRDVGMSSKLPVTPCEGVKGGSRGRSPLAGGLGGVPLNPRNPLQRG